MKSVLMAGNIWLKKDATNVAQHWTKISGDWFTNGLTGPNFCSTAIYNPDGGDYIPNYNEQLRFALQ